MYSYMVTLILATLLILGNCNLLESHILEPNNATKIDRLSFIELATKYGRTSEEFDVVTEDGYILRLFRLKGLQSKPVLLWHGFLDSGDTFILRGKLSTSVQLAEAGYDVWVANSRGNRYSRRHVSLDPDRDEEYWDFSFHEIGYYDVPAVIDFILAKTGQKQLSAIGHSQGTSIFYVLGATRPEYNDKIKLFISMAPIAYMNYMRGLLREIMPLWPIIKATLYVTGTEEILGDGSAVNNFIYNLCTIEVIGVELCQRRVLMPIAGNDIDEMEPEFFHLVARYFLAGVSRKDTNHFAQVINERRFAQYNYGWIKNFIKYGRFTPPNYDLGAVTMRVAMLCGENDPLSTLQDVSTLVKELPNVVYYKVMDRKEFNHVDFIWARNIHVCLNPLLKDLLEM